MSPNELPAKAQYYFNIMVIVIMLSHRTLQEVFNGQQITEYWNIENINEPRPYVVGFIGLADEDLYDEFQEDVSFLIETHPHSVVEVDPNMGITWFTMYDDDEEIDPWRI